MHLWQICFLLYWKADNKQTIEVPRILFVRDIGNKVGCKYTEKNKCIAFKNERRKILIS